MATSLVYRWEHYELLLLFAFGSMSLGQFAPAIKAVAKARSMAGPVFDIIERIPDIDVTSEDGIALSTNDAPSIG